LRVKKLRSPSPGYARYRVPGADAEHHTRDGYAPRTIYASGRRQLSSYEPGACWGHLTTQAPNGATSFLARGSAAGNLHRSEVSAEGATQVVLDGSPDEAAEFRRNGNLEWDLPTGLIWSDERIPVFCASLWVRCRWTKASTWSVSGHSIYDPRIWRPIQDLSTINNLSAVALAKEDQLSTYVA
jgi:hypothetical protein